jgi:hypothetical protein
LTNRTNLQVPSPPASRGAGGDSLLSASHWPTVDAYLEKLQGRRNTLANDMLYISAQQQHHQQQQQPPREDKPAEPHRFLPKTCVLQCWKTAAMCAGVVHYDRLLASAIEQDVNWWALAMSRLTGDGILQVELPPIPTTLVGVAQHDEPFSRPVKREGPTKRPQREEDDLVMRYSTPPNTGSHQPRAMSPVGGSGTSFSTSLRRAVQGLKVVKSP